MRIAASACAAALLWGPAAALHQPAPVPLAGEFAMPIVLDPGHGGEDLGAVNQGKYEKDLALAIALKLRRRLRVPVVLTREDDRYVTLDRRVVDAVDSNGALFVSLHINQVKSRKLAGAVVYSYGPEKLRVWRPKRRHPLVPPMPAPPRVGAKESELLARSVVNALREQGLRAEAAKSDYYVLKNPASPAVLIELGYMSNPDELARLSDPAHQDKLAGILARALESFAEQRAIRSGLASAAQ